MDALRFGAVIRAFSSTGTRRRFLAGLAALPLLGSDEAEARERKRRETNAKTSQNKKENQQRSSASARNATANA